MKICVKCGAELEDHDGFCRRCGSPQTVQANSGEYRMPDSASGLPEASGVSRVPDPMGAAGAYRMPDPPESSAAEKNGSADPAGPAPSGRFSSLLDREDHTAAYRPEDIEGNKLLCVLSYLGIFCLIPLLSGNKSPYLRFHTNQGLVLFLSTIILNMARALLAGLWIFGKIDTYLVSPIFTALNVLIFALTVIGIANVVRGKAAELPLIGKIRLI